MMQVLYCRFTTVLLSAILLSPIAAAPEHAPCCGPISPAGERLASFLDDMDVESLWLANEHVNWETGKPDRVAGYEGPGNHTHCSAFAAAAAMRLGVYLLRPPEHGQSLLSNAQAEWIASPEGQKAGWRPVSDMDKAQHMANEGHLVLVIYPNPDPHAPGHVAIVRPSEKSVQALEADGPEVIQAGQHNHNKICVRIGFENHPGAWPSGVRYYTHPLS
jgi:hypothetical protein